MRIKNIGNLFGVRAPDLGESLGYESTIFILQQYNFVIDVKSKHVQIFSFKKYSNTGK